MKQISLDIENYFITVIDNKDELKDIKKNWSKIINIDINNLDKNKNKIIKYISKNKNDIKRNWITVDGKKVIAVMEGFDEDIITAFKLILYENKSKRNEFLYDYLCTYLDKAFKENNYCDFKNNKCTAKRECKLEIGCCRHYKNKFLGIFKKDNLVKCEYLENGKCTADCITCKMFTYDTIKKKFNVNNMILIKEFFNIPQKIIIMTSYFKTRENILKRINMF